MVYEYAIDPSSLTSKHRLQLIADNVGTHLGRLVAEYPGSWRTTVGRSLNGQSPLERERLVTLFQRIRPYLIPAGRRDYNDQNGNWLSNAECVQATIHPFRAIVSEGNPRNHPEVLKIEDMDASTALWKTGHSLLVPRDAAMMADCAKLLLHIASDIVFVDPHFKPNSGQFLRPFEQFMRRCMNNRRGTPPRIRLMVRETEYDACSGDTFEQYCKTALSPLIPISLQCELVRFREKVTPSEKIHNRYVLTDRGGIDFGIGLDDDNGEGGQTDDVHLLEKEHFDTRWHQYALMEGFDEAVPPAIIVGVKQETVPPFAGNSGRLV